MHPSGRGHRWLLGAAVMTGIVLTASADTIYDNSVHDLNTRFNPGTLEVGNEVNFALGSPRFLTNFSFEYWGTASGVSFAGPVTAEVRFYLNNGAMFSGYSSPGTLFYDSGPFMVPSPTTRNTFVFTAGADFPANGLFLPVISNMTWTVQFSGMGVGDNVGVDLYSPPVVGSSYGDYWENDISGWALYTNTMPMDFASRFQATTPEPSAIALLFCGGIGLFAITRWRHGKLG
jgi:hypothetical protein